MGNVRIIAGELRGRNIQFPDEKDLRPATGIVKESIFETLENFGFPENFLDLYSGSGSMGLEAISRGARSVIFIDENPKLIRSLNETLTEFGVEEKGVVLIGRLPGFIKRLKLEERPGCIFVDPPFNSKLPDKTLKILLKWKHLSDDAIVIVRVNKTEDIKVKGFDILKDKTFGENRVLFLKKSR